MRDRLRKAREHAGLTQEELAERAKITRRTVSLVETGEVTPRKTTVNQWAESTGVPVEWLIKD